MKKLEKTPYVSFRATEKGTAYQFEQPTIVGNTKQYFKEGRSQFKIKIVAFGSAYVNSSNSLWHKANELAPELDTFFNTINS